MPSFPDCLSQHRRAIGIAALIVLAGTPSRVSAAYGIGVDLGGATDKETTTSEQAGYGFVAVTGFTMAMGEVDATGSGVALPLFGELRIGTEGQFSGLAAGGLTLYFGALQLGAGFGAQATQLSERTGSDGHNIDPPVMVSYPGILTAKLSAGSLFVQAQYFEILAGYTSRTLPLLNTQPDLSAPDPNAVSGVPAAPSDYREYRISLGHMGGEGRGHGRVIRLQGAYRIYRFDRVRDNAYGAYDRDEAAVSLGYSWFN